MSHVAADLPCDLIALHAFATACQAELAAATAELRAAQLAIQLRTLEIEKLKFQIAKLRRMQFGKSSEQLELQVEELETGEAEATSRDGAEQRPGPTRERKKPKRKPLPEHLPRQDIASGHSA